MVNTGGSMVKSLPAMQEVQVQALGQEDPLKKEMKTHSSIYAWGIPWPVALQATLSMGSQKGQTWLGD